MAELLEADQRDPLVGQCSAWIQAAFLLGWALGGSVFGRVGDRLGRSHTLVLTILTYALFTGLSFLANSWWHLLIFCFLAALGIGGEWAVGAALLSETWPRRWRPWLAAVLQSAVNVGTVLASLAIYLLASFPHRYVFLVGVLPALLVLWIRRAVPEPKEWHAARSQAGPVPPGLRDLFTGEVRQVTVVTLLVCSFLLTAHWAFMFWCSQHLRSLQDVADWSPTQKNELVSTAMALAMLASVLGNFFAAALARGLGYRRAIVAPSLGYFLGVLAAYGVPRGHRSLMYWIPVIGACQGVFALLTMYLPPLFPTLLRTIGAGFCYNIGRVAAAAGIVVFGLAFQVDDYRLALCCSGFLILPASAVACYLPEPPDEASGPRSGRDGGCLPTEV